METVFILVEPAVHENIGAAARALKTMGFSTLRLVNPADHLDERARWVAHASNEILEQAQIFTSLKDALHDIDVSIAATARRRTVKRDIINSHELKSLLDSKQDPSLKAGVVFGREDSGLTNEELALCDILTSVDLAAEYPSLNLAQAVMIYTYELSARKDPSEPYESTKSNAAVLKKTTAAVLDGTGIPPDSNLRLRVFELIGLLNGKQIRVMQSLFDRIIDRLGLSRFSD